MTIRKGRCVNKYVAVINRFIVMNFYNIDNITIIMILDLLYTTYVYTADQISCSYIFITHIIKYVAAQYVIM